MDFNNCRRQQGEKPYANTAENHRYRTLPGEQPSDMLKFVRKIDSDNSNKISPDQVRFYFVSIILSKYNFLISKLKCLRWGN